MRIAISTGGGDAPGLNAVIRAVVLSAHGRGWKAYGIQRGYEGLLVVQRRRAARARARCAASPTSAAPSWAPPTAATRSATSAATTQGEEYERDRSDDLVAAFQASGFDALVSIGGDGSLQISHDLWRKGLPVVCVPKTIDNDVSGTQRTFGFDTAVSTATEAIDKLHSTAESHERVHGGGGDGPVRRLDRALQRALRQRRRHPDSRDPVRHREGVREDPRAARRPDGTSASWWWPRAPGRGTARSSWSSAAASARWIGSGGIASKVARAIEHHTGKETRTLVLGHLQRGGTPDHLRPPAGAALRRRGGAGHRRPRLRRRWSGSTARTSPACRSSTSSAAPRTCRSTATPSAPPATWESAWVTEPRLPADAAPSTPSTCCTARRSPIRTAGSRTATIPTPAPGPSARTR